MKNILLTVFLSVSISSWAQAQSNQQAQFAALARSLDKDKTCRTPRQVVLAQRSVAWVYAYMVRDIKTQLNIFAPDFLLYHVTLSYLAMNAGSAAASLPFTAGPLTRTNYLQTIAFLGWANDVYQTKEQPTKVTCMDDDTTVMTLKFSGAQVKRDAQGYITHQVPYGGVATKLFSFDKQGRMIQQYVATDPMLSVRIRQQLAQIVQGPPNVAKSEQTRHTYQELLARYQQQAAQ